MFKFSILTILTAFLAFRALDQLHSVCFINNVYKQRFFGLFKVFETLNNRTSQKFHAKQQMEIS